MEIYGKNAVSQSQGRRFVRACAVETRMDISEEPFCVEIYRENAGRPGDHLNQTPGPNPHRKSPSVWPHCLGEKIKKIYLRFINLLTIYCQPRIYFM